MPRNFNKTIITKDEIEFASFKIIKSNNKQVLLHFKKPIRKPDLLDAGITRILT